MKRLLIPIIILLPILAFAGPPGSPPVTESTLSIDSSGLTNASGDKLDTVLGKDSIKLLEISSLCLPKQNEKKS